MHGKRKYIAVALVVATASASMPHPGAAQGGADIGGAIFGGLVGGAIGGAIGNKAGSAAAGAIIGAAAGAIIGSAIAAALDAEEERALSSATARAAASGRTGAKVAWAAPKKKVAKKKTAADTRVRQADAGSGAAPPANGYVVPVSDRYRDAKGRTCRDLKQVAVKDGKTLEDRVTACETSRGWAVPPKA